MYQFVDLSYICPNRIPLVQLLPVTMAQKSLQAISDIEHGKSGIGNAQPRYFYDPNDGYGSRFNEETGAEEKLDFQSLFGFFHSKYDQNKQKLRTCDGFGYNVLSAFIAELVATFFFVLATNVISETAFAAGDLPAALAYAIVAGFIYLLLKTVLGEVTAMMDPTRVIVELFMPHVWRTIGWLNAIVLSLVKIGAILIGAIAGGAVALALVDGDAGIPTYTTSFGLAFLAEFLGSGLLMWALLVTNYDRVSKWRNLTQGFVLIGLSLLFFTTTTSAFNFSRYFGAAVVTGNWSSQALVYAFAPWAGQASFAIIWFFLFRYPTGGLGRKTKDN